MGPTNWKNSSEFSIKIKASSLKDMHSKSRLQQVSNLVSVSMHFKLINDCTGYHMQQKI